jgi:hypothetical protein
MLIEKLSFSTEQLEVLVTSTFKACYHHGETVDLAQARAHHPTAAMLLVKNAATWKTPKGKKILISLFTRRGCLRFLIRPHLGSMKEFAPRANVLAFDLAQAMLENNEDKMRRLIEYGVSPVSWVWLLQRNPMPGDAAPVNRDGLKTLLGLKLMSDRNLENVLTEAIYGGCLVSLGHILDDSIGHKVPTISGRLVQEALKFDFPGEHGLECFRMLLNRAAKQGKLMRGYKGVDRVLTDRGGTGGAASVAWNEYKAKLPAVVEGEEDEGEEEADDYLAPGHGGMIYY